MALPSIEPKDRVGDAFIKFNTGAEKHVVRLLHQLMRNTKSTLSVAQRELIAAFVSGINKCEFCFGSHSSVAVLLGIDQDLINDLVEDIESTEFDRNFKYILHYVKKLTLTPSKMTQNDIDEVLNSGWTENVLYDAILVCCTFNFMNRYVEGVGIIANPDLFESDARRLLGGYNYIENKLR